MFVLMLVRVVVVLDVIWGEIFLGMIWVVKEKVFLEFRVVLIDKVD